MVTARENLVLGLVMLSLLRVCIWRQFGGVSGEGLSDEVEEGDIVGFGEMGSFSTDWEEDGLSSWAGAILSIVGPVEFYPGPNSRELVASESC